MVPGDHFILTGSFKPDCLHTNVILERRETKLLWRGKELSEKSLHIIIIDNQIVTDVPVQCRGVSVKSIIIIIVKVISRNLMWCVSLSTLIACYCSALCIICQERERVHAILNSLYFKRSFWFFYFVNWDKFALVHLILYKIEIEISIFSISYPNTLHILCV